MLCAVSACISSSVVLRMDRASQVLAQGVPVAVSKSYRALADYGGVPRSTLYYRPRGQRSIEEKAQSQQYLSLSEDEAVVEPCCKYSSTACRSTTGTPVAGSNTKT